MNKNLIRIVSILLAAMFVLGIVAYAAVQTNAVESDIQTDTETESEDPQTTSPDTTDEITDETTDDTADSSTGGYPVIPPEDPYVPEPIFKEDDLLLRVAIFFRSDSKESYRLRPSHGQFGFDLYSTTEDHEFGYLYSIKDVSDLCFAKGGNLYKHSESSSKWDYRSTSNLSVATVGGYHLLLPTVYAHATHLETSLSLLQKNDEDTKFIPAYINGEHRILIGEYFTESEANKASAALAETYGELSVISPSDENELKILDHQSGKILFYYLSSFEYGLGCYPIKEDGEENYIKIQSGYYWPGIFEAKRYDGSGKDAITLIMISEMEKYVESVVPWEISSAWPKETLKAFAICVRTYAYANLGRHSAYGCDLCSDSECQTSLGHDRVNAVVREAVAETKGLLSVCDGKPATAYYSAVTGGSIAAAHEVWNQLPQKYLVGQFTPWEKYETHKYGVWQYEATPEELCKYLRSQGYTKLKDAIKDIKINRLCENSSYVYSMTVTDIHGNQETMVRTRNVKNSIGAYLKSANFVISHNGIIEDGLPKTSTGIHVMTADGLKILGTENAEKIHVITSTGIKTTALPNILSVSTSSGPVTLDVLAEAENFVNGALNNSETKAEEENGNFIFIGKGYGHGAGMSQIGIRDLGELGYSYDKILLSYFPNTELVTYEEYLKMQ